MLSKKKYKHIFFDLDNTLWDFNKNSYFALQLAFQIFNIDKQGVNFQDFFQNYSKHNDLLWAQYRKKLVNKKDLIKLRFQNTFNDLTITAVDPLAMNTIYFEEMSKQLFLKDGAIEILEYLINRKLKLYIITNGFKEVQNKKLESSGLMKYFERVFISEEIKTPKPGREIFEYAIKSSNAKKTESIMVGDDWDVDVLGAINFGLDAVYYAENEKNTTTKVSRNYVFCIPKLDLIKEII